MNHVALEGWARLLLLGHAGLAVALAGASTHLALVCIKLIRRTSYQPRLIRVHGQTTSLLYIVTFFWGLLVYPTYRYYVRGLYLDRYVPAASNLFDMKENLAALGLPLAVALFVVSRRFEPRNQPDSVRMVTVLALAVFAMMAFSVVSGLWVTCVKGV
jgi:hypothetical protein